MLDFGYVSSDSSPPDIDELMASPILAFDVEGSGLNMGKDVPYGFSLAHKGTDAYYALMTHRPFLDLLADESKLKVAHNAKYDRSMMKKAGIEINNLFCTMIAAYLIEEPFLSLKVLDSKYLNIYMATYPELPKPPTAMTLHEMALFSGPHSVIALELKDILENEMKRKMVISVFHDIDMPLVPVLSDMELNGVMVDQDALAELGEYYNDKISTLQSALEHHAGRKGINFNSPQQVSKLLYKELSVPPPPPWRGGAGEYPSVDKRYLKDIKKPHPIIPIYLKYKEYRTLKDSYVDSLRKQLVGGRIYASFNQTRAGTGRLSSSGPNLQKIPARTEDGCKIRKAFIAPPGYTLVKADKDQLELKMVAHCSQDPALLDAFRAGRDIHVETAKRVFNDENRRSDGKTKNYQLIYGGGPIKDQNMLFRAYPGVKVWMEDMALWMASTGYARTIFKRRRAVPEFEYLRGNKIPWQAREGLSTNVQGSSADVVKIEMRRVWEAIKNSDVKMLMQVHDELVFQVPDGLIKEFVPVIQELMTYNGLSIPLTTTVSTGKNWGEMEKWAK